MAGSKIFIAPHFVFSDNYIIFDFHEMYLTGLIIDIFRSNYLGVIHNIMQYLSPYV
jgi:hypothetical protein